MACDKELKSFINWLGLLGGEAGPHFTLHHKQIKLPRAIRLISPDKAGINNSISMIRFDLHVLIKE